MTSVIHAATMNEETTRAIRAFGATANGAIHTIAGTAAQNTTFAGRHRSGELLAAIAVRAGARCSWRSSSWTGVTLIDSVLPIAICAHGQNADLQSSTSAHYARRIVRSFASTPMRSSCLSGMLTESTERY